MPILSVIMPVWNGEKHLHESIQSILSQTLKDFEFIILDDGSSDESPRILEAYARADKRIRVITLCHEGIVVALNRGVSEAQSSWIARMDCDDIAHPRRFEKQMAALNKRPDAILCHTAIRQIGEPEYMTCLPRFPRSTALIAARLCFQCPIVHPTVIFSKFAFLKSGGFIAEERHAEDFSLWGRLLSLGEFVGLPEPLLNFRVHSLSISKQKASTQEELGEKIALRHLQQFMNLTEPVARRAYSAVTRSNKAKLIGEWLWFVTRCLPRQRWQSIELWAWVCSQTIRRCFK